MGGIFNFPDNFTLDTNVRILFSSRKLNYLQLPVNVNFVSSMVFSTLSHTPVWSRTSTTAPVTPVAGEGQVQDRWNSSLDTCWQSTYGSVWGLMTNCMQNVHRLFVTHLSHHMTQCSS